MTTQFNQTAAQAAAREGAARADAHASPQWKDVADDVMHWCASNYHSFTSDQFWQRCTVLGIEPPPEPRAFAGVVKRAVANGYIRVTNHMVNSKRVAAHASPKRVYESLIPLAQGVRTPLNLCPTCWREM